MKTNYEERKKPLILVVDHDLVSRLYIERALQSEGYAVITTDNGMETLQLVKSHSPCLILMDIVMPEMDSHETCIKIRSSEGSLQTPIIMLTGIENIESVEKSFSSGANDFIVKPVNLGILKQRVRNALKIRHSDLKLYKHQVRQTHANRVARMGFWDWDIEKNHLYWSDEVYKIFSVSPDQFQTNREAFRAITHEEDYERIRHATKESALHGAPYSLEHRVIREDQQFQMVHQTAELFTDDSGKVVRMLGIVQDITETHLANKKIHHQAYYDILTDLPNRALFNERLEHALNMSSRSEQEIAIFFIDLDRFKSINESLGHDIGDKLLKSVTKYLKKVVRKVDTLARLSADEFALLIEGITTDEGVIQVTNKLTKALSKTHNIDGHELVSNASIGITVSSDKTRDQTTLIQQAELAVNHSKKSGGNCYSFFSEGMKSQAHQSLIVEKELRKALENEELVVYYQPKVNIKTGKINGMEALIRWQHPTKGLISPFKFIPIAEETGLIVPIGLWILEESCRQTKEWHDQGYSNLIVSVNVSPRQFYHKGFADEVNHALEKSGIPAHKVDLEVTESCAINNIDIAIALLSGFREKGLLISMDDFGTGFSSLSFLNQLPLDTLKVDRAFIKDINSKGENTELAKLIIAMAKSLNLKVVAEGVEIQAQLDFLRDNDCDEFQGYIVSPPVTPEEFKSLLSGEKDTSTIDEIAS